MTKLLSSAFILLQITLATAVSDTKPTFNCPGNTVCREFTDGCNSCRAPDGNTALAGCTEMYCACYNDDSCVPKCIDNPRCTLATTEESPLQIALLPAALDTKPTFNCPGNSVCREFTDGCNTCRAPDGNTALAGCTEMYCTCYDDGSCVPECIDNPRCTLATTQAAPERAPETIRFECMGNRVCMEYTDGCNRCTNPNGDYSMVGCTEMWCECYNDNSCEPECLSSNLCVPTGAGVPVDPPAPEKCIPTELDKELCPVDSVGCAPPPPSLTDCRYQPGNFVKDREGNCCENQCIFVDSLGKQCNHAAAEVAPVNPSPQPEDPAKENLKLSLARGGEGGGFGGFRQRRLKGGRKSAAN